MIRPFDYGFTNLIIMIITATKPLLKSRRLGIISEHSSVWIAAMLVIFFSAQVSGDLNDNRIFFANKLPDYSDYIARLRNVDLFLDTYPVSYTHLTLPTKA